ncbi:MAG: hypothetical protein GWN00_34135 [Aliifodinibius sp.]|nr:UPF0164 family protein [Fodinibius sp.]NIV15770.1 hypothetical protein [Fodinibius sp.]NIY29644.1 hypothetical protein [Fodinibius sp.]
MKRKMIKTRIYAGIITIVLLVSTIATGQDTKYAGAFLDLGIGARGMALGGAYVSVANDGSAFYWNPAGAATLLRAEVSGMYASLFKSLATHFYIGFTRPLHGAGAVSINWIRLSVSDIPRYDSKLLDNPNSTYASRVADGPDFALTNEPFGFSNNNNDALFITLSKQNKIDIDFGWQYFVMPITIPIGLNVKLIRQTLFDKEGSGIGFDFGSMLKFGLDDLLNDSHLGKVSVGFAVKDIFETEITWDTDSRHSDRITRTWHFGSSYLQPLPKLSSQLLFAYSLQKSQPNSPHNFGLEYLYYDRLAIRFGLTESKFTAGVGIKLSLFRFDYAFRSHELGGSHRINTSIQL